MINRIEAKGMNKMIKQLKWVAIGSLSLLIIRVLFLTDNFSELNFLDALLFLSPLLIYLRYRKEFDKKIGQYIEWSDNIIKFRTKDIENQILINSISSIEIKVHQILISTDDHNYKIDIEDFKNYKDRQTIKNFFKNQKKKLSTT
jgi:hypothetical protein